MAYSSAPAGQDINAKYNTANTELSQLYTLATSALPVAPDAVIQALIACRMTVQGLVPGQAQQLSMAPPPEPELMAVPPVPQPQPQQMYAPQMDQQQMYAQQQQMYAPQQPMYAPQAMSGHVQGGAPPPPAPAVLMPQGPYYAPPPPPPEQANFTRRADNWPPRSYHKSLGEAIHQAQEVRHGGGLEPRRSRGRHARLLLTRVRLASNRRPATCGTRRS